MANLEGSRYVNDWMSADDAPASAVDALFQRYGLNEPERARQQRVALLTRALQAQVLPKLVLEHSADVALHPAARLDAAGVRDFTQLVLRHDDAAGFSRIAAIAAAGAGVADICLGVLTPVARLLGEMWDDDLCSFVDVTTGLGALQIMLRRLREIGEPAATHEASRCVLLAGMTGNQHTFGLQMVAEVFGQAGWEVAVEPAATPAILTAMVAERWFAVVGISVAGEAQVGALAETVRGVRRASCNRTVGVLLGGPVFVADPELARRLGADVTALDARQAVLRAEGLRVLMLGV